MKKQCSKCKKEKDIIDFYKDKRTKSGSYSACKSCHLAIKKTINAKKSQRNWRIKNKEYVKKCANRYFIKRRKNDVKFHLDTNMGSVISYCLKGKKGWRKWGELVGYRVEDLIEHLEKQFNDKMSWDNYGNYWEIDHRTPKSWFKYKTAEDQEFKKCWALENLQPLEKVMNRSKNNRFTS